MYEIDVLQYVITKLQYFIKHLVFPCIVFLIPKRLKSLYSAFGCNAITTINANFTVFDRLT